MNGGLINWDFIRWSASSYSNLEIHYTANGASTVAPLMLCYPLLTSASSWVVNMVVSAIIGLTPFTNVHVTQMKVQTCEFRYYFVPVSKMLGSEEGKYRYWKIKQIPAEKPSEDN